MSIYFEFSNGEQEQVASNLGYSEFVSEVESADGMKSLKHLTEYGWANEDMPLVDELNELLDSVDSDTVSKTIEIMIDAIASNDGEAVAVSDGMSSESIEESCGPSCDCQDCTDAKVRESILSTWEEHLKDA